MQNKELGKFANLGLTKCYCGNINNIRLATVREVQVLTTHFEDYSKDATYTDQWVKSKQLTGGQEIIKVKKEIFTRLYAGGVVDTKEINELGITPEDIYKYLKNTIKENPDTRLFETVHSKEASNWEYSYNVIRKNNQIPLTIGEETIAYKGNTVFIQAIIMCLVK